VIFGQVVVYDTVNPVHMDAAGGDIGGDQNGAVPLLERRQRPVTLRLGPSAMQGDGWDSVALQALSDLVDDVTGTAEDHSGRETV
jgi:hypothetical protein